MNDLIRVVFIDDDKLVCQIVKKFLVNTGKYDVEVFADAKQGMSHIKKTIPDVVLLDIHMPGMSGVEMLKAIKKDPAISNIPVAMLTGDDHEETQDAAMSCYAEAYILKPVTKEKLDQTISAIIKNIRAPEKVI